MSEPETQKMEAGQTLTEIRLKLDGDLTALEAILGEDSTDLPGGIHIGVDGEVTAGGKRLDYQTLFDQVVSIAGDRRIETFQELSDFERRKALAVALSARAKFLKTGDEKQHREFQLQNIRATYYEYLPQVIHQVIVVIQKYRNMRAFADNFGVMVPDELLKQEEIAQQYLQILQKALNERVAFRSAVLAIKQVKLLDAVPQLERGIAQISAIKSPSAEQIANLEQYRHELKLAQALNLKTEEREELIRKRDEAIADARISPENKAVLRAAVSGGDNEEDLTRVASEQAKRILDILTGDPKATGLDQKFSPQKMYSALWSRVNSVLLRKKEKFKVRIATGEISAGDIVQHRKLVEYIKKTRLNMLGDLVEFAHDNGSYQMTLAELAAMQGQFGQLLNTDDVGPVPSRFTSKESEKDITKWIEQRRKHRYAQIGNILKSVEDDMLEVSTLHIAEDQWNEKGRKNVMDLSVYLARIAAALLPDKESGGMFGDAMRKVAEVMDVPRSKEDVINMLSGPMADALDWPRGDDGTPKVWNELSPEEKEKVQSKFESVLDKIGQFKVETITNLKGSMALVESMPSPQSFAGQEVDMKIVKALKGKDIRSDMTGEMVDGKKVNGATAYVLALRQVRSDWGDPDKGSGFIGEYKTFLLGVEDVLQVHMDTSAALYQMQLAWQNYAKTLAAVAAGTVITPFVAGLLAGSLPTLYTGYRFLRRGARTAASGTRAGTALTARTRAKLNSMRPFRRTQSRSMQALKKSRTGRFIRRLEFFRRIKLARGGARALRGLSWMAIPAFTAFDVASDTQLYFLAGKNKELKSEHGVQIWDDLVEGGALAGTLATSGILGPAALAAPVIYSASYNRDRREVRTGWLREVDNWDLEYDSAGLLLEIKKRDLGKEYESGGGGVYRTRIGQWLGGSESDTQEAFEAVHGANLAQRQNMYEAYLFQNLKVPEIPNPVAREEVAKRLLRNKITYLRELGTQFKAMKPESLIQADVYAELQENRRMMEELGEKIVIPYIDKQGKERQFDLSKLDDPRTSMSVVIEYMEEIQPIKELMFFNGMGDKAREEKSDEKWASSRDELRLMVMNKLRHDILSAEARIRSVDWPGWGISGGEQRARNLIRSYLSERMIGLLHPHLNEILEGRIKLLPYSQLLKGMGDVIKRVQTSDTDALHAEAIQYFEQNGGRVYSAQAAESGNPLYQLLASSEEEK